jgi:hypothetical protein
MMVFAFRIGEGDAGDGGLFGRQGAEEGLGGGGHFARRGFGGFVWCGAAGSGWQGEREEDGAEAAGAEREVHGDGYAAEWR